MASTTKRDPNRLQLGLSASAFFYLRLPSDFITDDLNSPDLAVYNCDPEFNNKWTKCFRALEQVPGFYSLKCGRLVENLADGILFVTALSPAALEVLLESPEWNDYLAALDLRTPPKYFHAVQPMHHLDEGRITIATLSFPYPATPEQRDSGFGCVPLPEMYYTMSPSPMGGRTLGPRPSRTWVRGPQLLPDGREVENGLLIQNWRWPEIEDLAAGEELEKRRIWMDQAASHFGLLAISVERYNIYLL